MTAQDLLKAALRDVLGPAARGHGYKGSAPTWRKSNTASDWAVVNVQSSSFSSAHHLRCVVNLAFAPEPWLRWESERLGRNVPTAVSEALGLYRQRLHPEGTPESTDGWWEVWDAESACRAVADMKSQLDRAGWPVLDRLFSREAMISQVRDGDLGWMRRSNLPGLFARAEALLLMDAGPSEALDAQLASAMSGITQAQHDSAARFDAWVRLQASSGRGKRGHSPE